MHQRLQVNEFGPGGNSIFDHLVNIVDREQSDEKLLRKFNQEFEPWQLLIQKCLLGRNQNDWTCSGEKSSICSTICHFQKRPQIRYELDLVCVAQGFQVKCFYADSLRYILVEILNLDVTKRYVWDDMNCYAACNSCSAVHDKRPARATTHENTGTWTVLVLMWRGVLLLWENQTPNTFHLKPGNGLTAEKLGSTSTYAKFDLFFRETHGD